MTKAELDDLVRLFQRKVDALLDITTLDKDSKRVISEELISEYKTGLVKVFGHGVAHGAMLTS